MQQNAGPSRVTAVPLGSSGHNDELLRAVQDAAAGSHEVLGEMGRDAGGHVIYLARDLQSAALVALRLDGADGDYVLDVARTLDPAVGRAMSAACGRCGAPLVGWGKFCPQCGADVAHAVTENVSRDELLDAVKAAARDEFEILGEMDRAEGGGVVYFARDLASGKVVTLRLRKEQDAGATESYSLGETQVLRPLVRAIGAAAPAPPAGAPSAPPTAPAERVPPAPTLAKAMMPRLTPQEVLIPADQMPVDETLPPRPPRQVPPWMIAGGVVGLVGVLAAAVFVHERLTAPDATRMDSVVAQAGQGPLALPPIDTAHVTVSDRVPATARLTVNGIVWQPPAIALPPGTYTLGAEIAGVAPVTETVTLKPGQTLLWSPALAATREKAARPVVASRPQPRKDAPRPAAQNTRKSAPTTTATVASTNAAPAPSVSCSSAFGSKDWPSALGACTRDAQAGDVNAQRDLGAMYLQGYGVTRDPTQAFTWFKKAADAGSRDGAYQLALMYEAGRGVPRDATQSTAWYKKAALLGDVDSQVKVGMAYENGTGVDVNMDQAVQWYRKAADQGSAWAQNRLGWLYGMGKGVNRDDAQAMKFFRAAADQGDPQAEFNVGFMYANGRGVPQDDSVAVSWFRKAAAQGWADAKKELKRRGLTQ